MKRFFGVLAIAVCLSIVGVDEAKAGGPFCITFPGFCDQITIRTSSGAGRTWIVGNWDWTCAGPGVDDTLVHGLNDGFSFGSQPVSGGVPSGVAHTFKFFAGMVDLAGTDDGVTNTVFQDNHAVALAAGVCPGHPVNAGMPRLLSGQ